MAYTILINPYRKNNDLLIKLIDSALIKFRETILIKDFIV